VEIYDPAEQIITRHFETKWGGSLDLNRKFRWWGSLFGDGLEMSRYSHVALCEKK